MNDIKVIHLVSGEFTIVDEEDFARCNVGKWTIHKGYAVRPESCLISLHRFVLKHNGRDDTHHKNGCALDNTKRNLVVVDETTHKATYGPLNTGKVHFKGVRWNYNGYQADLSHKGVRHYLRSYKTKEEAARAYDFLARKYHGPLAYLNFPNDPTNINDYSETYLRRRGH